MTSLERIKNHVGSETFQGWERQANEEMARTPHLFMGEEGRYNYLSNNIQTRYHAWCELYRRSPLPEAKTGVEEMRSERS